MVIKQAKAATTEQDLAGEVINSERFRTFFTNLETKVGSLVANEYKTAIETMARAPKDADKSKFIEKALNISMRGGNSASTASKELGGQLTLSDATKDLVQRGEVDKAKELVEKWNKGTLQTSEDILRQMQNWGYTDWVAQERDRLRSYELVISNLARQFAKEMAATQAKSFSMTSVTQQLTAITEFVEEKLKEMEEEKKKKEGTKEAEPESKVRRRKAKKKEAEELLKKIEAGKQIETPVESKLDRMKLYDEVKAAERAKDGLDVKELINEPKFQEIYEEKRDDELRGVLKGLVPEKVGQVAEVMKSGQGGQKVSLTKYDIAIQTALVSAYRKSLEEYAKAPKAG
jgi:hypothetical protein